MKLGGAGMGSLPPFSSLIQISSKKKSVPTPFTPCRNGFGESGLVLCGNGTNRRVEVTVGKPDVLPGKSVMNGTIFRVDRAAGVRIDQRAIGLRDQTSDRIGCWRGFLGTRVVSARIIRIVSAIRRIIGRTVGIACGIGIRVRVGFVGTINRLVRAHLLP